VAIAWAGASATTLTLVWVTASVIWLLTAVAAEDGLSLAMEQSSVGAGVAA